MNVKSSILMVAVAVLSLGGPARAESTPTAEEGEGATALKLPWTRPSGVRFGLGLDSGSWGGLWVNGVRAKVPFGNHFAVHVRGLAVFDYSGTSSPINLGGRIELIGQSPVMLNLIRLYGGGGIQAFYPLGGGVTGPVTFGGGGHFGFEFFLNPRYAFFIEVGGQGGGPASGATIMAGMNFYLS